MAIDTSMFGLNLPAATYTSGDVLTLANIRGPAIVRDGYGDAYLKRIICGLSRGSANAKVTGHVIVKNSNWVDEVANMAGISSPIMLAENSSNIQRGHDCRLTPNSGWSVQFVVDETVTTTVDNDLFCLVDVDYPKVQAVRNPREAAGTPMSIIRKDTITSAAFGTIASAAWTTYNVDFLKAGYRYLLTELGLYASGGGLGFISISGAAGQQGLERIIPLVADNSYMRYLLDYSTPLVKGPMNLNYLLITSTSGSVSTVAEIDWVKA